MVGRLWFPQKFSVSSFIAKMKDNNKQKDHSPAPISPEGRKMVSKKMVSSGSANTL